jgi:hypothetical protein
MKVWSSMRGSLYVYLIRSKGSRWQGGLSQSPRAGRTVHLSGERIKWALPEIRAMNTPGMVPDRRQAGCLSRGRRIWRVE